MHARGDMVDQQRRLQSVSWTWALGWLLASMGFVISDAYSSPNRGLTAAYLLGFIGWGIGAAGTVRYIHHRFGGEIHVVVLSMIGWGAGAVVAVALGLRWLEEWNAGFFGPIFGAALGGAIGGAL